MGRWSLTFCSDFYYQIGTPTPHPKYQRGSHIEVGHPPVFVNERIHSPATCPSISTSLECTPYSVGKPMSRWIPSSRIWTEHGWLCWWVIARPIVTKPCFRLSALLRGKKIDGIALGWLLSGWFVSSLLPPTAGRFIPREGSEVWSALQVVTGMGPCQDFLEGFIIICKLIDIYIYIYTYINNTYMHN